MTTSEKERVLKIIRKSNILRAKELEYHQISSKYLQLLSEEGLVERVGLGLYTLTNNPNITENHTLAIASKRIPRGIICLLSALRFHQITTQNPFEIWIAIHPKARLPKEDLIPLRCVRFSGKAFTSGIEKHFIEGVEVSIYSLEKTIADLFKYRNKIGVDVAVEALKEGWSEQRLNMNKIWEYAKICHVSNVIRPYLDML